jgi:hypothetical protein
MPNEAKSPEEPAKKPTDKAVDLHDMLTLPLRFFKRVGENWVAMLVVAPGNQPIWISAHKTAVDKRIMIDEVKNVVHVHPDAAWAAEKPRDFLMDLKRITFFEE